MTRNAGAGQWPHIFLQPDEHEVAASKNQVSHFGKLYNLLTNRIAPNVVGSADGIGEAYCYLLGKIGRQIDEPAV